MHISAPIVRNASQARSSGVGPVKIKIKVIFMDNEIIDYVNDNDCVVGSILRSEYKTVCPPYHIRGIQGFIRNDEGKLWIPRRTFAKKLLPGGLDSAVGGFVQSGETYDQAFARELREELNLIAEKITVQKIATLTPFQGLPAFLHVYEIQMNEAPDYNTEDFCEYAWMTPDEILAHLAQGASAKKVLSHVKTLFPDR